MEEITKGHHLTSDMTTAFVASTAGNGSRSGTDAATNTVNTSNQGGSGDSCNHHL